MDHYYVDGFYPVGDDFADYDDPNECFSDLIHDLPLVESVSDNDNGPQHGSNYDDHDDFPLVVPHYDYFLDQSDHISDYDDHDDFPPFSTSVEVHAEVHVEDSPGVESDFPSIDEPDDSYLEFFLRATTSFSDSFSDVPRPESPYFDAEEGFSGNRFMAEVEEGNPINHSFPNNDDSSDDDFSAAFSSLRLDLPQAVNERNVNKTDSKYQKSGQMPECRICYESFETVQACSTICGHLFCTHCMDNLKEDRETGPCPVCRTNISFNAVHPVYF